MNQNSSSIIPPDDKLYFAREYFARGLLSQAVENYMKYYQEVPKERLDPNFENEFVNFLCDSPIFFNATDEMPELVKCFLLTVSWFPNNSKLFNSFGSYLIKIGDITSGLQHILNAYKIAKEKGEPRLAIENNMLHVVWGLMPRWHFRMLNGKLRNESFKKAIHKALDKGLKYVIDIGSGCGLLSLYIGIHPSRPNILAFEVNPILRDKAVTLMANYCGGLDYNCYNKFSYSISEMVEPRRDLLVTEIFDVGFFGEGILKTLNHAFTVIMKEKGFTIIPCKVTLYVTGIHSKALNKKFRLLNSIPLLDDLELCVTKLTAEDPYDAEKFTLEKYEIMTETLEFLQVNLDCKDSVQYLLSESWMEYFNLKVIKSGVLDCFVMWFDLHLDEEVVISTNPFHKNYEPCWEQAIFHCKHPAKVEPNNSIDIKISVKEERLHFEIVKPPKCNCDQCFEISESAIQFLNDRDWIHYITALTEGVLELKRNLFIVDFCEFPLAGLIAAQRGHKVFCFYKDPLDVSFIKYVMRKARISESRISLSHYDCYPHLILVLEKLDFVVFEPIQQNGCLNPSPMENSIFRKQKWQCFFNSVIVHFALIHSPYLDYSSRVAKENVEPFDALVEEMNEYSGSEHPNLENNFSYELMSNETTWKLREEPFLVETLSGLKDGKVNGILTWFTLVGLTGVTFCTKESTTFRKNVFTFPERKVLQNEKLKILCQYKSSGLFQIEICQQMWLQSNFDRITTNSFFKNFFNKNFHA